MLHAPLLGSVSADEHTELHFLTLTFSRPWLERRYDRFLLRRYGKLLIFVLLFLIFRDTVGLTLSVILLVAWDQGDDPTVVQWDGHLAFALCKAGEMCVFTSLILFLRRERRRPRKGTRSRCCSWWSTWEASTSACFILSAWVSLWGFDAFAQMGYIGEVEDSGCVAALKDIFQGSGNVSTACAQTRVNDGLDEGWYPNGRLEQAMWSGLSMMAHLAATGILPLRIPWVLGVATCLVVLFIHHISHCVDDVANALDCVVELVVGAVVLGASAWRNELYRRTMFVQERAMHRNSIVAEVKLSQQRNPFSRANLKRWLNQPPSGHDPLLEEAEERMTPPPSGSDTSTGAVGARRTGRGGVLVRRSESEARDELPLLSISTPSLRHVAGAVAAAAVPPQPQQQQQQQQQQSPGTWAVSPLGTWQLDFDLVQIEDKIASGGCGQVFRARYGLDAGGQLVAVKQLFSNMMQSSGSLDEFGREAKALATAGNHPNVSRLLGVCKSVPATRTNKLLSSNNSLFLVTEWANRGNLKELLLDPTRPPNGVGRGGGDLAAVLAIAEQVAAAMAHLHAVGVCHNDLKPANCLLHNDEGGGGGGGGGGRRRSDGGGFSWTRLLVCDFGLAKCVAGDASVGGRVRQLSRVTMTLMQGTPLFMAPELARLPSEEEGSAAGGSPTSALLAARKRKEPLAVKSSMVKKYDVYSYAILLAACMTRNKPFSGCNETHPAIASGNHFLILAAVVSEGLRPILPDACPPRLAALVKQCWSVDPRERPSFDEIRRELAEIRRDELG